MSRIIPGSKVPNFDLKLQDGSTWSMKGQRPKYFTMLVIFRYSNCSVCKSYLKQLDETVEQFSEAGVGILAASVDNAMAVGQMAEQLSLGSLRFGCDIPMDMAEKWGLFISSKRKESEPDQFFEPALFLIDASGLLYYSSVQSMAFGRSSPSEILQWIPKLIDNAILARGEVTN